MAQIRIPDHSLPGIELIAQLSNSDISHLYDLLKNSPVGVPYPVFFKYLSENYKVEHISEIARSIFSLGSLLTTSEIDQEELPKAVLDSFIEQSSELAPEYLANLEERIKNILLNSNNIKISYDAYQAISRSSKVLRRSVINQDIRLLTDDRQDVKYGTILHILKVVYDTENRDGKSQQFVLDKNDLLILKTQIEAALVREEDIVANNYGKITFLKLSE
jgi:hypothetical protein